MTDSAATLSRLDRSRGRPDRVTVMLFTLAAFLAVFAILAARLRATPALTPAPPPRVVVLRRIYRTTIVDDGRSEGRGGAATVSVSTSGTASAAPTPAPTTRSSTHP
jgi:hypothetical protein